MSVPLLTLTALKSYLGLEADDDTYDDKFNASMPLVTALFEQYCDVGLARRVGIVDTINDNGTRVELWSRPVESVATIVADGAPLDVASLRLSKVGGWLDGFVRSYKELVITYTAGYEQDQVPSDLGNAYAQVVANRCGVTPIYASGGGSPAIKGIGLGGGALSVQFDTTNGGGVSGSYDASGATTELQPFVPVLDKYSRMKV